MVNSLTLPGTEPQFPGVGLVSTAEGFSVLKFGTSDPNLMFLLLGSTDDVLWHLTFSRQCVSRLQSFGT